MNFDNIDELKENGFVGFKTIRELFQDSSQIPSIKGVYFILNLDLRPPNYLLVGSGGHFKGKNPNVSINDLALNWIEKTIVIYIGKAGSNDSKATLKSRLKQYLNFGNGKPVGHWGGRLIWQIDSYPSLVICWKPLINEDPRAYERELIIDFKSQFGKRPFANLAD